MKLHRNIRRGCGPVGVVMIVYYVLSTIFLLRNHPFNHEQAQEYYNPAAGVITSQWGGRTSTVCGPGGCVTTTSNSPDDGESWLMPSSPADGWVYKRGGVEYGRIDRNGNTTGFVNVQPSWYPSGMPQAYQRVGQLTQPHSTGDLPPIGQPYAGQTPAPMPPNGVDKTKLAEDKAKIPGGVSINGHPESEALIHNRLSDSAKAQGLKDYENALRLVVVGHNDNERKPFVSIAKPLADSSDGKLIIQEYDDDDWQVKAHVNAAKSLPDYQQGKPFAYLQRFNGATKAIMYTPSEVAQVMKQARPEVAPNFDAARARALTKTSDDWLLWASGGFIALMGLVGAVTSKPQ